MSGGSLCNYDQYKIGYIADEIEQLIIKNGKPKRKEDRYSWDDENITYSNYSLKEIQKFQEAVLALRIAQVYAHRVDYLVSGDDGENSFHLRLEEELKEVRDKYTQEYFDKLIEMSLKDYYED
jgi:hypothetical protein